MRLRMFVSLFLIVLALAGASQVSVRATQTPDLISGDWDALFKVGEHTSPGPQNRLTPVLVLFATAHGLAAS